MCFSWELKHFQIEEHDFWQSEFDKQWYVLSFLRISKPVVWVEERVYVNYYKEVSLISYPHVKTQQKQQKQQ